MSITARAAKTRFILSARQLFFFHQKREYDDKKELSDVNDDNEDNKSYELGYN